MENAAYVSPPPLPPQAHLTAAFQASNTAVTSSGSTTPFQEALMSRMGRPFGLTGADMKDLPQGSPFFGLAAAARGAGVGGPGTTPNSLEGFPGGLPGALALSHHINQPGFGLHHFIDPRLPFSAAGAFRPIFGNTAAAAAAAAIAASQASTPSPLSEAIISQCKVSSAFQAPPSSKPGQTSPSSTTLFSPGQNLYPRSSAGSPGTPSSSPPAPYSSSTQPRNGGSGGGKLPDENSNMAVQVDRHDSISPASMDSSIQEDERANKKIRLSSSSGNEVGCCCPICGMHLRTSELEMHFAQELDYLPKLASLIVSTRGGGRSPNHHGMINASPTMKNQLSGSLEVAPRSRWDTFQRIQRNRQSRIRVKLSRRAGKRSDEILEEDEPNGIHHHVMHLGAHHKMEQPQSSSTPAPTSSTNPDEEDIDIVGDDGNNNKNNNSGNLSSSESSRDLQLHVYGPPQFTEADVLACMSNLEEMEKDKQQSQSELVNNTEDSESLIKREVRSPDSHNDEELVRNNKEDSKENQDANESKDKVFSNQDRSKCLKCLKSLKNPVVNVGCWHVQCENCWLISLGTKKSCSLCSTPTVPTDLRRVFL